MNKKYTQLYIINDIAQLSSVGRKDTSYIIVSNSGIYQYTTVSGSGYVQSADGGYWNNILGTSQ